VWLLGGWSQANANVQSEMLNDCWSTPDGVDWILRVSQAAWSGRRASGSAVVRGDSSYGIMVAGGEDIFGP
jgi:hypothetical protein